MRGNPCGILKYNVPRLPISSPPDREGGAGHFLLRGDVEGAGVIEIRAFLIHRFDEKTECLLDNNT